MTKASHLAVGIAELSARQPSRQLGHDVESALRLTVTDLHKSFRSPQGQAIEVLKGVTFSAQAGQTLGIVGASGAGKSTLLHILGGIESVERGEISLGGVAIHRARPAVLAQLRNGQIGFVFQFHHLLADLTAAENVALPLRIGRISRNETDSRTLKMLEQMGLGSQRNRPIGHLSGGEQQRVAVGRALITNPKLVLADEPTGNLDSPLAEEITKLLISHAKTERAIVLIATHSERLAKACGSALLLKDGQVFPILL